MELAPGVAADDSVVQALASWLAAPPAGAHTSIAAGFDPAFHRSGGERARATGRSWLAVWCTPDEVRFGPPWRPDRQGEACPGCAETRLRLADRSPQLDLWGEPSGSPRPPAPTLAVFAEVAAAHLGTVPLRAGQLLVAGPRGLRRHRVLRTPMCPVCGDGQPPAPRWTPATLGRDRPELLVLAPRPSPAPVPTRSRPDLPSAVAGDGRLGDARMGPVLLVQHEDHTPFPMAGAYLAAGRAGGFGRGRTPAEAATTAVLEAYERLGAFPHHGRIAQGVTPTEMGERALDLARLGRYSAAQLAHPQCRLRPYTPDTPMDWAVGHRLPGGEAVFVPAEVGFYFYDHDHRLDYFGDRRHPAPGGRDSAVHFFESSNGCALGASVEEAALHGLLEVAERDAYLLAWHARRPLPEIDHATITDPESRALLGIVDEHGFDAHLLVTTHDLGIPTVWALGVNRGGGVPATRTAGGAGVDPAAAVRAGLWELAQLVTEVVTWDPAAVRPLVADRTNVRTMEDHERLYALPEAAARPAEALGGPVVSLAEAFPGWPGELRRAAAGDVRGALLHVLDRFRAAGLDDVIAVDQTTTEHLQLGLHVVRAVVPGALPLCFGAPHQRLGGLPRLERLLAAQGRPVDDAVVLRDPHGFP